jgi:transcriptional regulator NrdR family protein
MKCPKCGSENIVLDVYLTANDTIVEHKYMCLRCRTRFKVEP